ncbi:HlyD family secretion protein [Methylobacterium gossipiicola]|uniref:Hemolysin D n=1 Tax=Methylobacterium gossipiicola TaxID=582675 RepID=A0A1I2VLF6_9HYPH|nr:HlyD family secretion protein [Methylobacterium gossipiicola]SFG88316.1 hemolysin D [Methylobacterium gossipiicola]
MTTADVLMRVVPDGSGIEIDAQMLNGDIGFVAEDQAVEVKLEAFPSTQYGLVKGRVRKLGRDAATGGSNGVVSGSTAPSLASSMATDLAYPAKVTLEQDWIGGEGRREAIRPGMRVSAEIRTGERRVIKYLLSPVVKTVQEAGRER